MRRTFGVYPKNSLNRCLPLTFRSPDGQSSSVRRHEPFAASVCVPLLVDKIAIHSSLVSTIRLLRPSSPTYAQYTEASSTASHNFSSLASKAEPLRVKIRICGTLLRRRLAHFWLLTTIENHPHPQPPFPLNPIAH